MITMMNCKDAWKYKVAHWKQHDAGPCPFPLPSSHLPPFPPLFNPSLSLSFSLPSWIKSIIPVCSPSEHFSAQLLWKVCVCVWTPRVCALRVLCVCIGLCGFFLSGAGVQPFISWADCRQGNTQISLCSFTTHAPATFWTFSRLAGFSYQSGTLSLLSFCPAGTISINGITQCLLYSFLIIFFTGIISCFLLNFISPPDLRTFKIASFARTCFQHNLPAQWLNLNMHKLENGCFSSKLSKCV